MGVIFQVGRFHELYDGQAVMAAETFALARLKLWLGERLRVGVPRRMAESLAWQMASAGLSVLVVNETGYPLLHVKERYPTVLYAAVAH